MSRVTAEVARAGAASTEQYGAALSRHLRDLGDVTSSGVDLSRSLPRVDHSRQQVVVSGIAVIAVLPSR